MYVNNTRFNISIYTVVFMCVEQYVKVKTLKIYTFLWPVK